MFTFLHQDPTLNEKIAYVDPTPDIFQHMGVDPTWSRVFQTIQKHVGLRFLHISFSKTPNGDYRNGKFSILTEDCKVSILFIGGCHNASLSDLDDETGEIRSQSKLDGFVDRMKMNSGQPQPLLTQYLYKQFHITCSDPMNSGVHGANGGYGGNVCGDIVRKSVKEFSEILMSSWWNTLEQDYVHKTFDVVVMKNVNDDLQRSLRQKTKECDDLTLKCKEFATQIATRDDALTISCMEVFQMRQRLDEKGAAHTELDNRLIQSKLQNDTHILRIKELEDMLDALKKDMESERQRQEEKVLEREECILRLTEENDRLHTKNEETMKEQSERCAELVLENRSLREELASFRKINDRYTEKIKELEMSIQDTRRDRVSVIINNHKIVSSSDDDSTDQPHGTSDVKGGKVPQQATLSDDDITDQPYGTSDVKGCKVPQKVSTVCKAKKLGRPYAIRK